MKTKALISFAVTHCEADLRLCFSICRLLVFPCSGSYFAVGLAEKVSGPHARLLNFLAHLSHLADKVSL